MKRIILFLAMITFFIAMPAEGMAAEDATVDCVKMQEELQFLESGYTPDGVYYESYQVLIPDGECSLQTGARTAASVDAERRVSYAGIVTPPKTLYATGVYNGSTYVGYLSLAGIAYKDGNTLATLKGKLYKK